jgi:UDP-2-acetamido-3-amino-2,3-dideoxy-glucuronate N-acetyltransferase
MAAKRADHKMDYKPLKMTDESYYAHPTAVIDQPCIIGAGTRIWHFTHIMSGSVIGENCTIGQNVFVATGVRLGRNVKIQNNVSLYTGVICEEDVFLGPSVVFTNVINPRSAVVRKNQYIATVVKKGASIGANATIVCGNEIGEYAFVGAGSVVTRPVPPYALVMGNPASQKGWISEYGHTLSFNENGEAVCPESGQIYQVKDGAISRLS